MFPMACMQVGAWTLTARRPAARTAAEATASALVVGMVSITVMDSVVGVVWLVRKKGSTPMMVTEPPSTRWAGPSVPSLPWGPRASEEEQGEAGYTGQGQADS